MAYLNIDRLSPLFTLIDKAGVEVQGSKSLQEADPAKVSVLLSLLTRMAALDRFVYHTYDGRSMVSLKWEKTLLEQQSAAYISTQSPKEELNVSRIFRRVYRSVVGFLRKHDEKISKVFKLGSVNDKILLMDTYCRAGLHIEAIVKGNQLETEAEGEAEGEAGGEVEGEAGRETLSVEVEQLGQDTFAVLVHLFNDIGLFINSDELKGQIFARIEDDILKEENNQMSHGLRETIDVINYLLQNHRKHSQFTDLYQRYLSVLESKATYFTPSEHDNEFLVEAFKILALEKPEKYGSHPVYLNYIRNFVHDDYKKNPFHSILR